MNSIYEINNKTITYQTHTHTPSLCDEKSLHKRIERSGWGYISVKCVTNDYDDDDDGNDEKCACTILKKEKKNLNKLICNVLVPLYCPVCACGIFGRFSAFFRLFLLLFYFWFFSFGYSKSFLRPLLYLSICVCVFFLISMFRLFPLCYHSYHSHIRNVYIYI